MSYYLIRVGEGSKYIDEAKKGNFVAIGWNEIPDLKNFNNVDQIKKALEKSTYNYSPTQINIQAGQIFRFGFEIQEGDAVLSPLGSGEYLVGKLGKYYFEDNLKGNCNYKHRRTVFWNEKTLLKEDMSVNLSYTLGAILTIFSLNKHANEIENLILGQTPTPAEKPQRIRDIIIDSLTGLDGKEFEEFIKHILEVVGFTAETTQYVGDKGIDVNGVLDAEGLAEITLRVQVKRVHGSINNKEVLAIRGALEQGEHPCLITLSKFTSKAQEEAVATGKIPVKLIDGYDLAGLILKHFDEIDEKYKDIFNIRRKKSLNIEDLFELDIATEEEEKVIKKVESGQKPDWDTIVCPAKEDGFIEAFLGKKAWWQVPLRQQTIPFIKYIAIYQSGPISKITYYGKVKEIKPYENTGKFIIYLDGDPIKLDNPIGHGKNKYLHPQGSKYAKIKDILIAKSLDDVFY